jgi:hypothetical protein
MPDSDSTDTPQQTADQSIVSALRARRSKIGRGADPLDLAVPGYGGELVIRYRWVPLEELTVTAESLSEIKGQAELTIAASADTLVATCQEVFVKWDGELKPLSTDGTPVKFDDRLAYSLGIESKSARQVATDTFSNEYSLIQTGNVVVEWLKDTTRKVNADFLGE